MVGYVLDELMKEFAMKNTRIVYFGSLRTVECLRKCFYVTCFSKKLFCLALVALMLVCCKEDMRYVSESGTDSDTDTADVETRLFGSVWQSNDPCGEYSGSVDPIHIRLFRLSDLCGEISPSEIVEGCEGYYNSGDIYDFHLKDGGCFRFEAIDSTTLYTIRSVFPVHDGETVKYDVEPNCLDF